MKKPGVLSVRPGYQVAGGWPTKKPAIVVVVDTKRDDLAPQDRLPETIEGYAVDVRQATPLQRMRATMPAVYKNVVASVGPELEQPVFRYERDLSGQPLAPLTTEATAMRGAAKQQIRYVPPNGAPLKAVIDEMAITCHASPDAGWLTLKQFLEGTESTLTVGMYDFTSTHIADTVVDVLKKRSTSLSLVLDHPPGKEIREQTDDDTVDQLTSALGNRFHFAWALERSDPKVQTWIFPSAYHIKVAVRDSSAFWLSSGNWNSTNQPDIDPFKDPAGASSVVKQSDRDWHVIVDNETLAKLYETYLLNDLKFASQHQADAAKMDALALAVDNNSALAQMAEPTLLLAARVPKQYFEPKTITAKMKIQPILTPDNYADLILELINSAQKSLYMQTQYINYSDTPENAKFTALVEAVVKKIDDGLDVRLIMSQYETVDKLELLQGVGVDLSRVRVQANVHN